MPAQEGWNDVAWPIPRFKAHPEGLEGRDPDFIRRMLPRLWVGTALYFRPEVNGFDKVPDEPVLFVGNHSGGANVPDTFVFTLAYNTWLDRKSTRMNSSH